MENFTVTNAAVEKLATMLNPEEGKNFLRIRVDGGGCSGFQYHFEFDDSQKDNDHLITEKNITVLIDDVSFPFLEGSSLDYSNKLGAASFKIDNPNATANCGCGSSFSV